jgi:hypothetical protein
MEFNFRAESNDVLRSVHTFNDDFLVDDETYRSIMSDGYMSTGSFVVGAAKKFGIDIDSETMERWKRVISAGHLFDDYVDNASDINAACDFYAYGLDLVLGQDNLDYIETVELPEDADDRLIPAIILLKNSVAELPEDQLAVLRHAALAINTITKQKTSCDDVGRYIELLKRESYYTGVLQSASASSHMFSQSNYAAFCEWFTQALTAGVMGDNAIDLRKDYEQHITAVKPTIAAISRLAMVHEIEARKATIGSLHERIHFYF